MKILHTSDVGQRLLQFGVTREELAATHVFQWDLQPGGAGTFPLSDSSAVIFAKGRYLPTNPEGRLLDGPHVALIAHEFCHVRQIREWGALSYMGRHIGARIKTRSILARESDVEKPCYDVQHRVRSEYDNS